MFVKDFGIEGQVEKKLSIWMSNFCIFWLLWIVYLTHSLLFIFLSVRLRSHRTILFGYPVRVYAGQADSLNRTKLTHNTGSNKRALFYTAAYLRIV